MTELVIEPRFRRYIHFCNYFHKYNLPFLRREISDQYRQIYKDVYNLHEEDVAKATFIVFLITFISFFLILFFIIAIDILYFKLFWAGIFSIIIASITTYNFNSVLFRRIKKDEKVINALLTLIKINFSLVGKIFKESSDLTIAFIKLIMRYELPISGLFKKMFNKILLGYTPEKEIKKVISPSSDFNKFLKELLIKKFDYNYRYDYFSETSSEKNFRIVLKSIETKIGIVFFIGLFFPILLGFIVLFLRIGVLSTIFITPFFIYSLHFLFKKLIKINTALIGLTNEYRGPEKKRFDEFLIYLEAMALRLEYRYSPEVAFIKAYNENSRYFKMLKEPLKYHIAYLISFQHTFREFIDKLKLELKAPRYKIILDVIYNMLERSSFDTSEKIADISRIIERHRRLEERYEIIMEGKKFTVAVFVFLFPIVLGIIGGMLPLLFAIVKSMEDFENMATVQYLHELMVVSDIIILFIILFLCNLITCYYFLKIIHYKRFVFILILSSIFFIVFFLTGLMISFSFF